MKTILVNLILPILPPNVWMSCRKLANQYQLSVPANAQTQMMEICEKYAFLQILTKIKSMCFKSTNQMDHGSN